VDHVGLSLTILGSSGTYAGPGEACSGYLVESEGTAVWVDTGPGTLGRVQQHVGLDELAGVVVTHHHPDHWLDLPVLRNALKYVLRRHCLPVYGTSENKRLADCLMELEPTLDWTTIADGDSFDIGPLSFRCSRTDHSVETLALRIDAGGRSLAYSADTGRGWSVSALGDGIDLFLCEASMAGEGEEGVHLSASEAGAMARIAGVARLVLTHLVPGTDPDEQRRAAGAAFGRDVELAEPGTRFEI
jgi:ribonuclease BN (tRNA processing enzyme)